MEPFVFHHPTKIIFGRHGLDHLGPACARLGGKLLLLYGRQHLRASGLHRRVTGALTAAGVNWREYGGIGPNPTLVQIRPAIALARTEKIDAVVAVGGGSVMDGAKAVAAGACVEHDIWLFFRGKKSIRRALPLLCLPTLAGSGSESNHGMVLTNEEQQQKIGIGNRHLLPALAILDPELTSSTGWRQTLYGAVDIISHLLEIFCTAPPGNPQDRLALALIKSVMENCEKLRQQPTSYEARAELLWASSLALSGLNSAGRGRVAMPAHLLAHALGGRYDLPHGAALAVVLPAWLQYLGNYKPQRVAAWARAIFPDLGHSPTPAPQDINVKAYRRWLAAMGAPTTLGDLGIKGDRRELEALADHAHPQARLWRLDYGRDDLLTILQHAQRENSPAGPL